MADSQRLNDLRQQRELIAAHLRWLDAQIAAETGTTPPPSESVASPTFARPITPISGAATEPAVKAAATVDPDALIEELLEEGETSDRPISKTGCWVIFASIMFVAGGLAIWAIYHFWG